MSSIYAFNCGVVVTLFATTYGKQIFIRGYKMFFAAFLSYFAKEYNLAADEYKKKLFSSMLKDASGQGDGNLTVLEIGAGTGANFKYYPSGTSIICLEPNDSCDSYLRKNITELGDRLVLKEFRVGFAENMVGIQSDSVDAVVSTLVLCSVGDVKQSLQEVLRVLKPGGKFYFLEHIVHEETAPWFNFQKKFAPIEWHLIECRITQATHLLIEKAGFSLVERELFHMDKLTEMKPKLMGLWGNVLTHHTLGTATK